MIERYSDLGQVRGLWEGIKIDSDRQHGYDNMRGELTESAVSYLVSKQMQHSGQAYYDQIEKNVIYLGEGAHFFLLMMTSYLCTGEPLVPASEVPSAAMSTRQYALESSSYHLNFVRNGCRACPAHEDHSRWEGLRQLRETAKRDDYIEELEFSCVYYQLKFLITNSFLQAMLASHMIAGLAALLPPKDVLAALHERAEQTVAYWGGLLRLTTQPVLDDQGSIVGWLPTPLPEPPRHWREIWGKEFDAISQKMRR